MAYQFIISSPLTNMLQVINYTDKFKLHPVEKTFNYEYKNDNYTLSIKIPKSCKLRPSVANLLNLMLIKYTESSEATFDISLAEYMNYTGLTKRDRILSQADLILKKTDPTAFKKRDIDSRKKEARKVISADIDTLSKITLQFSCKYMRFNSAIFIKLTKERRGNITGEFHAEFFKYLAKNKKHLMIYPDSIARTNCSRMNNPYVFALKNKINQLCKMNMYDPLKKDKKEFFDIKIETLLKVCYLNGMSTPEELYQKYLESGKKLKPHYSRDIKDIFDKTMEIVEVEENEYYSIEYHTSKKASMYDDEDMDSNDFLKWQQGYIQVIFKDGYPREDFDPSKLRKKKSKK